MDSKDQDKIVKIYESFYGGMDQQPAKQNHTPNAAGPGLSYGKGQVPTTSPGHSGPINTMSSDEEDNFNNPESTLADLVEALNELVLSWRGTDVYSADDCAEELTNLLDALDL